MSKTLFEHAGTLRIGSVDFVSPDEIKVLLDIEAPDSVALNTGGPMPFPRVNSYVLIPVDDGYLVGQIEWLTVERSSFPKRRGMQDFGVIDMPYPLRRMSLNPLGTLRKRSNRTEKYVFRRGADAFPSIGSGVLLPTDTQLRSIVESGDRRRVKLGTSPLAGHAEVCVDPDRIFGRHLAVLGNTGSGKSCTVSGLIHWSLEQAQAFSGKTPNARFIVLDPNGEYANAFGDTARIFQVNSETNPLKVPLWFWNSAEWCAFTHASARAQVPLIKRALRSMRNEEFEVSDNIDIAAKRFLGIILQSIISSKNSGEPFYKEFPDAKNFMDRLSLWSTSVGEYDEIIDFDLSELRRTLDESVAAHKVKQPNGWINYSVFLASEVDALIDCLRTTYEGLGGSPNDLLPKNEDVPVKFPGNIFVDFLEGLAQETGNEQYVEFLLARIRTMLADTRMSSVISDDEDITLESWLMQYIGGSTGEGGCVSVIDLSLVPAEIIHLVTSVISRMCFESLQRYRKLKAKTLPTVLVMEEAHTFIKKYRENSEDQNVSAICCQVFEKIAREGRKFGLGLVLSSQRPSELSPTVLSQCNTFLLHRISNDRDQELVHKLVPDNLRGLLRELPSLPSQNAILLGWASELPVLVRMNDLPKSHQPHSADPDYWDVWVGQDEDGSMVKRDVNWKEISSEWQNKMLTEEQCIHCEDFLTEQESEFCNTGGVECCDCICTKCLKAYVNCSGCGCKTQNEDICDVCRDHIED
ncbi:MAG: ATP-binding protein [Desulfuromonadaceae bacterium]|nr:ATP-binding protein [Desulfuromonadaceae bacterium]